MIFENVQKAINRVEIAMQFSDKTAKNLNPIFKPWKHLKGLSSPAVREFFNVLCSSPETRYLEVGVHIGSSLIAACYDNPIKRAVGIDNWMMDPNSKPQLVAQLNTFKDHLRKKPEIIEVDAFSMTDVDHEKLGEFDIYFYDGHHSADSTEKGLTHFFRNLAPVSIVILDDYSVFRVQQGAIRAIDKIGCKQHLRYAWTLPGGKGFENLYWGGLAVMVFQK